MAIIKGFFFEFLHNNGISSVFTRIASILMSPHNKQFHDKIRKKSLIFLELSEEFRRDSKSSSN